MTQFAERRGRWSALLTIPIFAAAVLGSAGGLLTAQGSARAASPTVAVGSPTNRFAPNVVTVNAGDTVTFSWSSGTHTVDLKDVSPDLQIDSSHTSGTTTAFTTPGTYYYYCSIHATEDQATEAHVQANDAMVGKIVVQAASGSTATATATSPASATAARTATTAPAAPSTGSGYGGGDGLFSLPILLIAGAALLLVATAGAVVVRGRR